VAGSVAVQRKMPPSVNVTVPVAPPGSPVTESVSSVPKAMVAGAAVSVIDVPTVLMVKSAPVATPLP
jgi:hypothetical protein